MRESRIRYIDSKIFLRPDPGFWTKTSWLQLAYGFWVHLTYIAIGLAFGFPAVSIPQLDADSSIILTQMEISWIASVLTLASPVGCILCGFLMDRVGRHFAIVLSQVPMTFGWIYIGFATTAIDIIIGRIITGVGCGMAMTGPRVYISEISLPNMRGVIGAFPALSFSLGVIIQATFGSYFDWRTLSLICSIYTVILLITDLWLPETPYFKLLKDNAEKAKNSLKKFRAKDYDVEAEMEQLLEFKTDNNIRRLNMKEHISTLFTTSSCKPFSIILMYLIIVQLSGVSVFLTWTLDVFERSQTGVDPHMGNIILGVTRFLSGIVVAILLFKIGRKPLALVSGLGVGVTCLLVSGYFYYTESITIFPLVCYIIYIISATLGYYTLPLLIMVELYPLQVRGILGGLSVSFLMILMFLSIYFYPYVRDAIGFRNTILLFGVCSLLGCIFIFFCLPETKDLTLQEIEEYYNERRPTLISQRKIMSLQLSGTMLSPIKDTRREKQKQVQIIDKRRNKNDKDLSSKTEVKLRISNKKKDNSEDQSKDEPGPSKTTKQIITESDNKEQIGDEYKKEENQ